MIFGSLRAWARGLWRPIPAHARIGVRVAVCSIIILLWTVFAMMAAYEHSDVWQKAYLNASSASRIVALDIGRNLDVLELTLRGLDDGLAFPGVGSLPLKDRNQVLYDRAASAEFFANLFVLNEHGDLVVDSGSLTPRHVNYADREYFRFLRDHPGQAMYVNGPALSKVGDGWTMPVAIRLDRPDGAFAGVAVGGLRLGYILRLFEQVNVDKGDTISLIRGDGTVVARWPAVPGTIGAVSEYAPSATPQMQDGAKWTQGRSTIDGGERFLLSSQVGKYPLTVTVGISTSDLFDAWIWRIVWIGMLLLVLSGIVIALTFRLTRELSLRTRSEAKLAQQYAALELSRQQFDAALGNMSQGLTFVDGDRRLVVCNRRYREIYRLSPEHTRAGTPLADILRHRMASGSFPNMTMADYLARHEAIAGAARPFDVMDELADGRTISLHYEPLPNQGWVTTHEDITERRRAEADLVFLARHDALTRLPNRFLFRERLEQAIEMAGRGAGCAVICLDLDHFKLINDTLGHPVGDGLLQAAAGRLQACVRDVDTVARLGGDEFAIIQSGVERSEDAEILAMRIIKAFQRPFDIDGNRIVIGTSVGVAMAPADGASPETLLKHADIALYLSKDAGRGMVRFFQPEMDARMQLGRGLGLELRDALARNEFELHYQPLVNVGTGRVSGLEALLRWRHPVRGLLKPTEFIALTEETGLIVEIGEWVLRTACAEARNWPADIVVAVNLSPSQFSKGDIVAAVKAALDASGLQPDRLELEITEKVLLQDSPETLAALHALRAMGIAVALDDFGIGYSSLGYLRSFPFDKIKIDQRFVRDLLNDRESLLILRAVTGLGRSLCITTTAEGVETLEQLDKLREAGCTEIQGYVFSHPRPASALASLIEGINRGSGPARVLERDEQFSSR
jgi:diguanylate cyclase (GGDEF)-like protein